MKNNTKIINEIKNLLKKVKKSKQILNSIVINDKSKSSSAFHYYSGQIQAYENIINILTDILERNDNEIS